MEGVKKELTEQKKKDLHAVYNWIIVLLSHELTDKNDTLKLFSFLNYGTGGFFFEDTNSWEDDSFTPMAQTIWFPSAPLCK